MQYWCFVMYSFLYPHVKKTGISGPSRTICTTPLLAKDGCFRSPYLNAYKRCNSRLYEVLPQYFLSQVLRTFSGKFDIGHRQNNINCLL